MIITGITEYDGPHGWCNTGTSGYADITLKKTYVSTPVPHPCDEIIVEPCGCAFHRGERLKTCDGCLQRRLGP